MSTDTFEIEALDQPTFTQVGHWVAFRSDLSPTARHLYTVLATFVNQGRRANGDTDVWPSLNLLAVVLGLSKGESVTPYIDELIQARIVVKTSHSIGGMNARNHYAIRFNPPPGAATASSLKDLLAPLKEIADDPKAMSKAAKDTRELIKKRRERESAPRSKGKGKTAGRAVPRKTGVRAPESRGTHPGKPGSNKTQDELDGGRTTPLLQEDGHADPEPAPAPEKKKTKRLPKEQEREQAKTLIGKRLPDSTPDEQDAIIDIVYAEAATKGIKIGFIATYIEGRPDALLEQDLAQVRRHSAAPTATECGIHQTDMPPRGCDACAGEIKAGDRDQFAAHLAKVGEKARPDLARLLGTPQSATGNVRVLDEGERIRRMQRRPSGVVGGSRTPVADHAFYSQHTDEELRAMFM